MIHNLRQNPKECRVSDADECSQKNNWRRRHILVLLVVALKLVQQRERNVWCRCTLWTCKQASWAGYNICTRASASWWRERQNDRRRHAITNVCGRRPWLHGWVVGLHGFFLTDFTWPSWWMDHDRRVQWAGARRPAKFFLRPRPPTRPFIDLSALTYVLDKKSVESRNETIFKITQFFPLVSGPFQAAHPRSCQLVMLRSSYGNDFSTGTIRMNFCTRSSSCIGH